MVEQEKIIAVLPLMHPSRDRLAYAERAAEGAGVVVLSETERAAYLPARGGWRRRAYTIYDRIAGGPAGEKIKVRVIHTIPIRTTGYYDPVFSFPTLPTLTSNSRVRYRIACGIGKPWPDFS